MVTVSRPALVKLGGSVLTAKGTGGGFQKPAAKRLMSEIRKSDVPCVLLHGAGSYGHPEAQRHKLGRVRLQGRAAADAVAETLAAVQLLHAHVVATAAGAGLRPLSMPPNGMHSEAGTLVDLPVARVTQAIADGFMPVLHGTVVRDDRLGWRVASADEILAELAGELQPRLVVFATDVDGVFDGDPEAPGAKPRSRLSPADAPEVDAGDDATGGMAGKLARAFQAARYGPTLVVNGLVRNRLLDALKGKNVVGTRIEP